MTAVQMKKQRYVTYSIAQARQFNSDNVVNSDERNIKRMKEDFSDMFFAEHEYRKSIGDLSIVFVLTFNDAHVLKKYGRNLLDADRLKMFSKSSKFAKRMLRTFGVSFDYVCCGEYGAGGVTHDYVGKRGVLNNPHYHCIGWWHVEDEDVRSNHALQFEYISSVPGLLSITIADLEHRFYDVLNLLLRYEWQHSVTSDPKIVGKVEQYKIAEQIGYVDLCGSVIDSKGGSAYISKYIGKDIKELFKGIYTERFAPNFFTIAIDVLREELADYVYYHEIDYLLPGIVKYWCERCTGAVNIHLFRKWCALNLTDIVTNEVVINPLLTRELVTALDYHYNLFYDDFFEDLNKRASTKLRKFHGFGYQLFDGVINSRNKQVVKCNQLEQTYTCNLGSKVVTRRLPPSLIRHYYYNYTVTINAADGRKVVRYGLNELGIETIKVKFKKEYQRCLSMLYASPDSVLLRECFNSASIFYAYLQHYDIEFNHFDDYEFCCVLEDWRNAEKYAIAVRSGEIPLISVPDTRQYVDIHRYMQDFYPDVYMCYRHLVDYHRVNAEELERKAKEFNARGYRVYSQTI